MNMKKKSNQTPPNLPRELRERLITLGKEIHALIVARKFDEAERLCRQGLELIPNPSDAYIETAWYCSGLGEIYFLRGEFSQARELYERARLILEKYGESDPYTLLRLGEAALETGDEASALRNMLGAYKAEGWEIFEGHSKKYCEFLKNNI